MSISEKGQNVLKQFGNYIKLFFFFILIYFIQLMTIMKIVGMAAVTSVAGLPIVGRTLCNKMCARSNHFYLRCQPYN